MLPGTSKPGAVSKFNFARPHEEFVLRLTKIVVLLGLLFGLAGLAVAGPESGDPVPSTVGKFKLSSKNISPEVPDTGAVPTETERLE